MGNIDTIANLSMTRVEFSILTCLGCLPYFLLEYLLLALSSITSSFINAIRAHASVLFFDHVHFFNNSLDPNEKLDELSPSITSFAEDIALFC